MPKASIEGIFAEPGEFLYGSGMGARTEIKSVEELKRAVEKYPTVPITWGHPKVTDENPLGEPQDEDYIGTAYLVWNEKHQRANVAKANFYDEYWYKIDPGIQRRIEENHPLATSAGLFVDESEDKVQRGIVIRYLAVLRDGEDPVCPLGTCGLNIRRESKMSSRIRIEKKTELGSEDDAKDVKAGPVDTDQHLAALTKTVASLADVVATLVKATNDTEPVRESEPVKEEKVEEQTPEPEPEPVPEIVVPAGDPKPAQRWKRDDQGNAVIRPKVRKSV